MLNRLYRIFAVPLFADNYSYIISTTANQSLVLIDPANPPVILDCVERFFPSYQITHVLYTHKHWDHAGGSEYLINTINNPNLKVFIGEKDANDVKVANTIISGDQSFMVPCHTRGHVIYHFTPTATSQPIPIHNIQKMMTNQGKQILKFEEQQCVFSGDTLFSGGIGRFFEGQAEDMLKNMYKIQKNVPSKCSIFNGHQYTLSNLKWAVEVQPNNQQLKSYYEKIQTVSCTLPTTLERQSQINLFYRVVTGTPLYNTITNNQVQLMRILRQMKNNNKFTYQL